MLKFLPRLVLRTNSWPSYVQQIAVGYRADNYNCDFCWYKRQWGEDFTKWACALKYKCSQFKNPYIYVQPLHDDEIQNLRHPNDPTRLYYDYTRMTRQVKVKGWPLYLQLIACDDTAPQCNAYCYFHKERMEKHQTVAQCAHTHGCSRSGSFFDLLIPTNEDIREQFFMELNQQQP